MEIMFPENIVNKRRALNLAYQVLALAGAVLVSFGVVFLSREAIQAVVSAFILFAAGWLIVLAWSKNLTDRSQAEFLKKILILAFLARVAYVFCLYGVHLAFDLPLFRGEGSDDRAYHEISIAIAREMREAGLGAGLRLAVFHYLGNFGYALLNAFIYLLLGEPNTIVARLINCLFGALVPALCFLIARAVYADLKIARAAAVLAALFPDFIVFASVQYKDTIVMFLTLYVLWRSLQLAEKMTMKRILLLLAALLILAVFRLAAAAVLLAVIIFQVFIQKGLRAFSVLLIAAVLALGFNLFSERYQLGGWYFLNLSKTHQLSRTLTELYVRNLVGDTSVAAKLVGAGAGQAALLMFNLGLFIAAPLPGRQFDIFTPLLPGTWIWYILIPAVFFGLLYSARNKPGKSWLLYSFAILMPVIIVSSLIASNSRYREQIMPVMLIFSVVGFVNCPEQIRRIYPWYFLSMVTGISTYLFLKVYG